MQALKVIMSNSIKVVGFDPSMRNWGIAIGSVSLDTGYMTIEELRTTHTFPQPKGGRVRSSTWDIQNAYALFEGAFEAAKDADIICVEVPTGAQNNKGATGHGICLGILGSLFSNKLVLVTPQSVKKIIGDAAASKAESVALAVKRHPEAPWPMWQGKVSVTKAEHCADAIHAIYAGAQTKEFKSLIQEYKHASSNQKTAQD